MLRALLRGYYSPHIPKLIYKLRGWLMVPFVAFLLVCRLWEVEEDGVSFGLGGGLLVLGFLLRVWAQTHLHYRLHVKKTLTQTGPYAFVRNPIYLGNTIILVSLCFLSELYWFVPIMLAWCVLVYHLTIRYEEAHLQEKYGAPYREYMTRIPRWLPRPKALLGVGTQRGTLLFSSLIVECPLILLALPFICKELLA